MEKVNVVQIIINSLAPFIPIIIGAVLLKAMLPSMLRNLGKLIADMAKQKGRDYAVKKLNTSEGSKIIKASRAAYSILNDSSVKGIGLGDQLDKAFIDKKEDENDILKWQRWLPYKRKIRILNRSEVAMLEKLRLVFNRRSFEVLASVRMLDLVEIDSSNCSEHYKQYAMIKIGMMQLDFVICRKLTTEVLVAIELDSPFHDTDEGRLRDAKKDIVMAAVGIPIRRFRVEEKIRHGELRELFLADPVIAPLLHDPAQD